MKNLLQKSELNRKLRNFITLCFVCLMAIGNAWGQETATMQYAGSTTTNMTNVNNAASVGLDAVHWSVIADKGGNSNYPGLNKSGQIRLYGASNNHNAITVSNSDGATISMIVVTYGSANNNNNNNAKVSVGGSEVTGSGTDTEKTYDINNSSFTIAHNYSTNTQVYILSIVIYYSSGPTLATNPTSLNLGSVYINTQAQATFTVIQANLTNDIILSATNGSVTPSTINAGDTNTTVTYTITPSAAGSISDTITLSCSDLDEDVTINVSGVAIDSNAIVAYEHYTGALEEGDYVIYYGGKAMKNTVPNNRLDYLVVSPANNIITNPDASIVWHIAPSGDYWTIYNASVNKYAAGNGTKNQATLLPYGTDNGLLWTVAQANNSFDFTNKKNSDNNVNATLRNNGTYGFACYGTGTGGALSLYKKVSSTSVATPTFTPAAGSYTEAQNVTISCETQGATIYYTTDGSTPDSTSLEYDGAISVSATTTVKAIAYLGSEYSSVTSATYTIITPSPIADARTSSDTNVTVKGVVTFKDGTTSYIEDATGAIAVYSSSLSSVALGDELLVSGKKKDFNGLLEIQNLTYSEILSQNNPLPLTTKTLAEINADFLNQNALQGMRVKIENAEIGAIQTNSNTTLSQDGTTTNIYKIPELSGISEGNIVNVNAIVSCYNGWQLRVAQASDVVLVSEGATYTVSVAQGQDTIVSVDPTEASSGTSIEVMVETPNGYYLSGISVIKETGDPVTSVSGGEGFYSFVMPAANVTVSANLLLYYDVNIAADQTDYIIVDPGRAYEGQEVAVMVEAPNGQQVSSVTVSKADLTEVETSFEDDLYYFIMPSEAVTVSATFEDIPTYVVTFNAGNGTCTTSTAQYQVGSDALILPTAEPSTECSAQGWNFMGWTTEQISGTTETAPVTLLTGEYAPTSDVTLYAVFTYASGASSESIWEKATSISVGDQVCLVCEGVSKELDSISTTSTKYGVGTAYTGSIAGLYPMTVEAGSAEGTYAFKNEVGKYLYWKSGNSLTVDTLDNKASWKVLFEEVSGVASNATIKNAADPARQIMWNYSSPRFACYAGQTPNYNSGTGYSAVQLYKLTGGATTIYATSMNCNSCVIEAEDLPYTEDFEGYTTSTNPVTFVEPDCWTLAHEYVVKDPDTVPNLYYSNSTTFIHSGNYSLRMWLRDIYAMPKISEDIDIRTLKMTLWVRQSYSFYMLQVGVMSDLNDESTFVPVAVINNGTTQMEMSEVDFSQYVGDGRYIAFKNIGTSSSDSHSVNFIDDITLSVSDVACGISSLPYSENFDSYTTAILAKTGVQPNCWTIAHKDVAMSGENEPQIYYNSNFAHESNYSLRMYGRCIYAMPKLDDNINVQDIRMSMYLRQPHSCYPLQVGVMSDLDDVNTYVPVTTIRNSSANIEHVTFDFSSYTGTGKYIVFRNVISGGSDPVSTNYIDDITLTQLDECGMITLPYQENFENMTTITTKATGIQPRCWAVAHEDVTLTNTNKPQLYYCSSFASSGNYTLRMYGRCIYAMPMLSDNVSVSDLTMGMYLRQPYACYPLQIGVMSDLDDASTFVPVTTIKIGGGNVQYVEVDFSSYTGEGKYIAFRNIISGGSDPVSTNYIDDININYTSEYTRALPFNMLVVNAPMDVEVEKFELSMELSQARAIENAMLENEVSIYPIPTTGEISIDASENVEKVEVYNNIGRLVATFNNQREINISDMPAGLYMLRVTLQGDAVVMKKVVKK